MLEVTTYSGSVYYVEGTKITGGSRNLTDGRLISPVIILTSMMIETPERAYLHPERERPGITTSHVVRIKVVHGKAN